ncbi:MAG: hypothetical protein FWB85_09530 [Chitinispirillia bacterium]|nr:hypothetical protein [Chitinispirillia bacterium]MCL2242423.1 hypothetical protein [Chitinispirillia bacterium]
MQIIIRSISLTALLLLALSVSVLAQHRSAAADAVPADSSAQSHPAAEHPAAEKAAADSPAHDQPADAQAHTGASIETGSLEADQTADAHPETGEPAPAEQVDAAPEPAIAAERTAEDVIAGGRKAVAPPSTPAKTTQTQPQQWQPPRYSDAFAFGGYASVNTRDGYRKYKGEDQYQHVPGNDLFTYAVTGSKRFALADPLYRLQSSFEIGWGRVKDDEYMVDLTDGSETMAILYSRYTTFGIQADLHHLYPAHMRTFFLSAGIGLHMTSFHETLNDAWTVPERELFASDRIWTLSPSANIGAGVEYNIDSNNTLSVNYNLRLMMSTNFTETGSMFPMGAEYREFVFSHMIQIQLLFPQKTIKAID